MAQGWIRNTNWPSKCSETPRLADAHAGRPCTEAEAIHRGFGGRRSARRWEMLAETLRVFQQAKPPDHFHQLAHENHERWTGSAVLSPARLEVQIHAGKWGNVTLDWSHRYGRIFAVLSMVNAYIPSGSRGVPRPFELPAHGPQVKTCWTCS